MRPGVLVRPARPDDLDDLVDLCLEARGEAAVGSQLCTDATDRLRDQIGVLVGLPTGRVLIGQLDDEPAGFLLARVVEPGLFLDVTSLGIEAVYVRAGARRRGLGHALLGGAVAAAEEAGATELYAAPIPGARGMHRFLARLGFAPAASHRVVTTAALQRRLAHEHAAAAAQGRRSAPRGLEDLIARRRQAREGRVRHDEVPAGADQRASISMQVNRAVQSRRPSASSTTTW
ncbi:GNAT family N-acetyltransferase [Cellulomonas alba]|uniref:GNAT family N-acetyltransferase n=1 Tax=Cellulomonas alba TaxID=3053467 RepID=A0ABT7SJI0_9CELL|nr:GNAT family N-acetyltransferase [Cellulomonas alba]MDM7856346.1 GNAT family N-acetyltransferase [Cellulomonas alba]